MYPLHMVVSRNVTIPNDHINISKVYIMKQLYMTTWDATITDHWQPYRSKGKKIRSQNNREQQEILSKTISSSQEDYINIRD